MSKYILRQNARKFKHFKANSSPASLLFSHSNKSTPPPSASALIASNIISQWIIANPTLSTSNSEVTS